MGDVKPYQLPAELVQMHALIAADPPPPVSIMEIGVWEGGNLRWFREMFPGASIIGIDPEPWPSAYEQDATILTGPSQDGDIQAQATELLQGRCDLVFIDGAHDEDSARQDFDFALRLEPRWIGLHDITCRTHGELDVWKVWDLVKLSADREGWTIHEISADPSWWGIGLINLNRKD